MGFANDGSALTLEKALELSRTQSVDIKTAQAQLAAQEAREAAVDGVYDATIFSKFQLANDESEQNSNFAGTERNIRKTEVGIRKLFATGTNIEVSGSYEKSQTKFQGPPPPTVITNPAHTGNIQLTLRQPLWRNFLSREIRLQQRLQKAHSDTARLQVELRQQISQAETEQLYWNLSALNAQLQLAKQIAAKSRAFATIMRDRQEFGRADEIDVLNAESRAIQSDTQLLEIELNQGDVKQKLANKLNLSSDQIVMPAENILAKPSLSVPAMEVSSALEVARQQRIDLKIVTNQMEPIRLQKKLAEEQYKPTVNLFASLGSNGIEPERQDAVSEPFDLDHKTTVVGVELEWKPFNRKSSYEAFAAQAQMKVAESEFQSGLQNLERDIKFAIHKLDSSAKQKAQAEQQLKFYNSKLRSDEQKFAQVRSEKAALLGHELEILHAKVSLLNAELGARQAEAMLRLATHAYPRGQADANH